MSYWSLKTLRRLLRPVKQWFNRTLRIDAGIFLSKPIESNIDSSVYPSYEISDNTNAPFLRPDLPISKEEFASRVKNGNKFFELYVDQSPVSYIWVACTGSSIGVLHDLRLEIPENALYFWDVATAPKYRGRGLLSLIINGFLQQTRHNANVAWTAVAVSNQSSRRALEKAGFRPMFTYFSIQFLGRTLLSLVIKEGKLTKAQAVFDRLSSGYMSV